MVHNFFIQSQTQGAGAAKVKQNVLFPWIKPHAWVPIRSTLADYRLTVHMILLIKQ